MKLIFQVTHELEVESDNLLGDSPENFLKLCMEEDPASLLDGSVILKYKLLKVTEEDTSADDEDDDDGLTELDEEELEI